ncbi:MAG TPA: O-antigen ligase family protein [Candidatus Polarisedimenticolia bacterium]|jgi:O-antigen ligase
MRTIPRPGATIEALLDMMMEGLIIALLVFTPLAFGTVQTWALCLAQAGITVVFGLWLCRLIWSRPASRPARTFVVADTSFNLLGYHFIRTGLGIPAAAFVALVLLQLVPLPPGAVRLASPAAAEVFSRALPGYADGLPTDFTAAEAWLIPGAQPEVVPALLGVEGDLPIDADVSFSASRPVSLYPFATWGRLLTLVSLLMIFVVTAHCLQSPVQQERVCWIVTLTGFGMSVLGVLQLLAWNGRIYWFYPVPDDASPFGPFLNHNHFAAYLEMAIPLALAVFVIHVRRGRPAASPLVLSGFSAVVMLATLSLAGSRGAILSLTAASLIYGAVMIARRQVGRLEWSVAAGAVAAALLFSAWVGGERLTQMATRLQSMAHFEQEPSLSARLVTWASTLRIVGDYPVTGAGLGTFAEACIHYYPPGTASVWREADNDYLQIAAEMGIPGILVVAAGLAVFLRRFLFRSPAAEQGAASSSVSIHHGMAIGILAILLHESIDFSLQVGAIALLFVALSGLMVGGTVRREGA